MTETDRWLALLEKDGGRVTTPRRAIVNLLVNAIHAMDASEIYNVVRRENPRVGLVTVYRTLDLLARLGLVERIHLKDDCHMILHAAHGHEHAVLCTNCGRAEYISGEDLSGWMERVSLESGFKIQSHWLQLQGLCKDCQKAEEKTK